MADDPLSVLFDELDVQVIAGEVTYLGVDVGAVVAEGDGEVAGPSRRAPGHTLQNSIYA